MSPKCVLVHNPAHLQGAHSVATAWTAHSGRRCCQAEGQCDSDSGLYTSIRPHIKPTHCSMVNARLVCVHAVCSDVRRGAASPGIGVPGICEPPCGAGNQAHVLWKLATSLLCGVCPPQHCPTPQSKATGTVGLMNGLTGHLPTQLQVTVQFGPTALSPRAQRVGCSPSVSVTLLFLEQNTLPKAT